MSKRAKELAIKAYSNIEQPAWDELCPKTLFVRYTERDAFVKGYEQAENDIIAIIQSRLNEIIGDAQPKPILRLELQQLIKTIKEE